MDGGSSGEILYVLWFRNVLPGLKSALTSLTTRMPHKEEMYQILFNQVIKYQSFTLCVWIFPVEMSCCWRRWFSTASSTIWRSNKPPPCCPVSSSRRTYEQTHTNTFLIPLILRTNGYLILSEHWHKQMIPVPTHFKPPITFLDSSPALQTKQKPEVDVCLSGLMKPVVSMRRSSVGWFNKPFVWL